MPAVSFCKGIPPFQRRERSLESTAGILATHQLGFLIVQVLIVHGTLSVQLKFFFRTAQFFRDLVDTPVVVGIFQRTSRVLMDLHIVRHIPQFVVIFMSQATGRRDSRMYILRTMDQAFVHRFQIVDLHTFHISIHQNGSRIVTHHATTMSRTCPFREEAAFLIGIDQTFLHLLVHRRIHQVQERKQGTERIPKAGIRKHISRQYFTVVRAIMNDVSGCIYFIEFTREQQRTVHAGIECTVLV